MMMIQVLPEGTSCTGTCEVLPRSHDGVGVTLHLLPPGDHIGSFQDDVDDDDDDDVDDDDDEKYAPDGVAKWQYIQGN